MELSLMVLGRVVVVFDLSEFTEDRFGNSTTRCTDGEGNCRRRPPAEHGLNQTLAGGGFGFYSGWYALAWAALSFGGGMGAMGRGPIGTRHIIIMESHKTTPGA
jgi:hypothetical protein